jgi:hypothetical protein
VTKRIHRLLEHPDQVLKVDSQSNHRKTGEQISKLSYEEFPGAINSNA